MKSSCCVLVAWFLSVVSLGQAQLHEGESCSLDDGDMGVCTTMNNCPGVREQIGLGMSPKLCMFEIGRPIVCCRNVPSVVTTSPVRQTNATRKTRSSATTTTISRVDSNTKAGKKCREYARYVYWEVAEETLLPFPEIYNKTVCGVLLEALIVGGVEASEKEFPHMAALGYGQKEDIQWKCGGSLISERFVLTAGHCLAAHGFGQVRWVRLGTLHLHSSNPEVKTFAVIERIKHEGYKPPAHYNDIALLKLDSDVTFSEFIRPACLNTIPGNPQGRPNATASGWGKLEYNTDVGSEVLMKVDLSFQPETRCNDTFQRLIKPYSNLKDGITTESMICAGDPKGKKDTCGGDSGGPLQITLASPDPFCMYSIIGLTSFGVNNCGQAGQPAVYTRVSNFIPWIERHVWP